MDANHRDFEAEITAIHENEQAQVKVHPEAQIATLTSL
jgi:hypothetical protein